MIFCRHHLYLVLVVLLTSPAWADAEIEAASLENALAKAIEESKCLFIAFLGEGWSVSSDRFSRNVLSKESFKEFADSRLVYFPVKARRKPKLSSSETAVLQSWVIHYDIRSYPTFILLSPGGQELIRHGFREVNAEEYITLLEAMLPVQEGS